MLLRRFSQITPHPRREDPKDAGSPGTALLVRAGFIHQIGAGIWAYTPLGLRVRRKIEAIIREEMDAAGAMELELPILQPQAMWESSGRWEKYQTAGIAFNSRDRRGGEYMLAPTAEEVIVAYVNDAIASYRGLPLNLYQQSPKFRNEFRPRQGLIRGREFVMKDAYSFDADEAGMNASYEAMRRAYHRVFERCGFLQFLAVQADSGSIGGQGSSEFMAVTDVGEDVLLHCPDCSYGANQEKAVTTFTYPEGEQGELERLETPNIRTVEELVGFTSLQADQMAQTIVMLADGEPVIITNRGDLTISEVKLRNLLGAESVGTADEAVVREVTGAPVGFAGPIGLFGKNPTYNGKPVRYFFDHSVEGLQNFLCGGNEEDVHYTNVNAGRDFPMPEQWYDLTNVEAGHDCPNCDGSLQSSQGIELGHIFKLQQVYSAAMGATFQDKEGNDVPFWMGCYGIGTSRAVQAVVEQSYNQDGIVWPAQIAPYQIFVAAAHKKQVSGAEQVAEELNRHFAGEVLFDDRGVKFGAMARDSELIGFPLRVVIGRDYQGDEPKVEVTVRSKQTCLTEKHLKNRALPKDQQEKMPRNTSKLMTIPEFIAWWQGCLADGSAFTGEFSVG